MYFCGDKQDGGPRNYGVVLVLAEYMGLGIKGHGEKTGDAFPRQLKKRGRIRAENGEEKGTEK